MNKYDQRIDGLLDRARMNAIRLGAASCRESAALFHAVKQEADVLQSLAELPGVSGEYRAALEHVAAHIRTIARMGARQAGSSADQIRQVLGCLKAANGDDDE